MAIFRWVTQERVLTVSLSRTLRERLATSLSPVSKLEYFHDMCCSGSIDQRLLRNLRGSLLFERNLPGPNHVSRKGRDTVSYVTAEHPRNRYTVHKMLIDLPTTIFNFLRRANLKVVVAVVATVGLTVGTYKSIVTNDTRVERRRRRRGTRGGRRNIIYPAVPRTNIHDRAVNLTVGVRRSPDVTRDLMRRLLADIAEEGYSVWNPITGTHLKIDDPTDAAAGEIVRDALDQAWDDPAHAMFEDSMAASYVNRILQDRVAQGSLPGHWTKERLKWEYWWRERLGYDHPEPEA